MVLAGALVVGLLLAVPRLEGVASTVSSMKVEWVVGAVLLEVLSCASYAVAFLQVFERAPFRVGAEVALSEEAFGAAVALGGAGSLAVGGWLMVERGAPMRRIAECSAVLFLYTSAINVITLILACLASSSVSRAPAMHCSASCRPLSGPSCSCRLCCWRATSTALFGG